MIESNKILVKPIDKTDHISIFITKAEPETQLLIGYNRDLWEPDLFKQWSVEKIGKCATKKIEFKNGEIITVSQDQQFYVAINESSDPIKVRARDLELYDHVLDPQIGQLDIIKVTNGGIRNCLTINSTESDNLFIVGKKYNILACTTKIQ